MATWVRANQLGALFVATLVLGLLLISVGLFTIGCTVGFIGTGILVIAAGHWMAYLRTIGAPR